MDSEVSRLARESKYPHAMNKLKKWVVCIKSSVEDVAVVQMAAKLSEIFPPEKLILAHVVDEEGIPPYLMREIPDLHAADMHETREKLLSVIASHFKHLGQVEQVLLHGDVLTELLRYTYDIKADLVFVGDDASDSGLITRKMVRKSSSSIMVVPHTSNLQINHVGIFTDFSEHSKIAFRIGSSLLREMQVPRVSAVHLFNDATRFVVDTPESPYDAMMLMKKRMILDDRLEQLARHKLKQEIDQVQLPVEPHVIASGAKNRRSEQLVNWVNDNEVDMVIMGSKGVKPGVATLLGSVTENVYVSVSGKILLIVKQKNENKSFLKSIFAS